MSDTPKYSYWYLSEEEQKRLEQERLAEELRLRRLRLEAMEELRKARLCSFKQQLEEQIVLQEETIRNLQTEFQSLDCTGGESLEQMLTEFPELQNVLREAEWDEAVHQVQSRLNKQKKSLNTLTDFLHTKKKFLESLTSTIQELLDREGLRGFTPPAATESQIADLKQQVRLADSPDLLLQIRKEWKKTDSTLQEQFRFYDFGEQLDAIVSGIQNWNRKQIPTEFLREFQRLNESVNATRNALQEHRLAEASATLSTTRNLFTVLDQKLSEYSSAVKILQEENTKNLRELEAKYTGLRAKSDTQPEFTEFFTRFESHLKQLKAADSRQDFNQFDSLYHRISEELESLRLLLTQMEQLNTLESQFQSGLEYWKWFVPTETEKFLHRLPLLRRQVQNRQAIQFEEEFQSLQNFFSTVQTRIQPQIQACSIHQNAVLSRLNTERDLLSACTSDPVVSRWASEELVQQTSRLKSLEAQINTHSSSEVLHEMESQLLDWHSQMLQILDAANELQQKERKRQYLLLRFTEKFRELGFRTETPYFENEQNPASGIILTADRPEGRTVNVRFDQEESEPIMYAVDGFPMPQQKIDGHEYRTCDEAQRQLEILHKLLEKNGILMGKVQWEDQPPVDLAREAMEFPDAAYREREAQ